MSRLMVTCWLMLASVAAVYCVWIDEMENPGMFEGDIELDPDEREEIFKTNSYASIKGGRWPGAKIPYTIASSIDSRGRAAIARAIENYHKNTCLKFIRRNRESTYINFYGASSGCSSPVGYRQGRRNNIKLANRCFSTGIVMHEIGHSIGLYHEQSRPDRDQYVKILFSNIPFLKKFNFNKKGGIDSLGTAYDFRSIMHYSSTAFGSGKRTIETRDPANQRLIGQRRDFSQIDIKQINLMYCGGVGPNPSLNPGTVPPTRAPVSLPPGCDNKDKDCGHFASNGWCTDNKEKQWMADNCCAACKGALCEDRNSRCKEWANRSPSECDGNPTYMHRVCQISCNKC